MWQEERHRRIRALLSTSDSISTEHVANELGVSRETVRRDLLELEARGELRRVHGGAISVRDQAGMPAPRASVRHERAIARAAAALLDDGLTLFIDAGEHALALAEELPMTRGLTVITNAFDVAVRLGEQTSPAAHESRVIVLGGSVRGALPATQGDHTVAEIHRYRADVALLGPTGIDARHGASHNDLGLAEIARAMVANAGRVILLADHAKVGVGSRVAYCPADRVGCLVTNRRAEGMQGYEDLAAAVGEVVLV